MRADVTIFFKDAEPVKKKNVEIEETLTALIVFDSEHEWSKVPLVAINYYDVKVLS